MGKYTCTGCSYQFNSEDPTNCPSCGVGIDECIDDEQSAQDILGDVEDLLSD